MPDVVDGALKVHEIEYLFGRLKLDRHVTIGEERDRNVVAIGNGGTQLVNALNDRGRSGHGYGVLVPAQKPVANGSPTISPSMCSNPGRGSTSPTHKRCSQGAGSPNLIMESIEYSAVVLTNSEVSPVQLTHTIPTWVWTTCP